MLPMIPLFLVAAISANAAVAQPSAAVWPCHFKGSVVAGCRSGDVDTRDVAVEIYRRYGLNSRELDQPYTREVLARSYCRVVRNDGGRAWKIYARGPVKIATLSGYEPVLLVDLPEAGEFLWMSAGYVEGVCPPLPGPTRHVFDPSKPPP